MKIQQFENKNLAHYSYAILSECENKIVLIDPERNPAKYYAYAKEQDSTIVGVIETHPHADFVSSHLEIHHTTGASIYVSKLIDPAYPFIPFDEGQTLEVGRIKLRAINTPGHSPDSISIVLEHDGVDKALFSGDTLFIGDCGRPDLRESGGHTNEERTFLAKQMYSSLRNKLMRLGDEVVLYPAHGAGTLCGKALSEASSSTIGAEKIGNWSLQEMSEGEFVKALNSDQPFIPAYFSYNVQLNRHGAAGFEESIQAVKITEGEVPPADERWIIDSRDEKAYKRGHLPHSINLMEGKQFETWLGSIILPGEGFYLLADHAENLRRLLERVASIGYEGQICGAFFPSAGQEVMAPLDIDLLRQYPEQFTIIDLRNVAEVKQHQLLRNSINIPLHQLRKSLAEIPTEKPIAVHCAGGYRSAAGSSIISSYLSSRTDLHGNTPVFDIGEAIKEFN